MTNGQIEVRWPYLARKAVRFFGGSDFRNWTEIATPPALLNGEFVCTMTNTQSWSFFYSTLADLDSDGDGVGDNADAFPNDASETLDTDGDGMGDNEQAVLEAQLAKEEEEAAAAAQRNMLIGIGLVMIIITAAVVVVLRKRMAEEGEAEVKDFGASSLPAGMPDMNAQPAATTDTTYDPMATAGYTAAQPAQTYDAMATAGYTAQPAAVQPVDDSALSALVEPEPVAAPAAVQPEPETAPAEPTMVNQWTDENGHTWRVMSDGTNRWWNGNDWQKV